MNAMILKYFSIRVQSYRIKIWTTLYGYIQFSLTSKIHFQYSLTSIAWRIESSLDLQKTRNIPLPFVNSRIIKIRAVPEFDPTTLNILLPLKFNEKSRRFNLLFTFRRMSLWQRVFSKLISELPPQQTLILRVPSDSSIRRGLRGSIYEGSCAGKCTHFIFPSLYYVKTAAMRFCFV